MATEVVKIVDPGEGEGHDYHSLSLWEAGEQGDLTGVRDEIAVAKCRATDGDADTTAVVIDGWTTSATQYIKIWTDPSESHRHEGVWSDSKYRLSLNTGGMIKMSTIGQDNIHLKIDGLQMSIIVDENEDYNNCIYTAYRSNNNFDISNNIFKMSVSSGYSDENRGIYLQSEGTFRIWNNIFYGIRTGSSQTDSSAAIAINSSNVTAYIYNNTVIDCDYGFNYVSGSTVVAVLKNNIAQDCTNGYNGSFSAASDYNISDLASDAPGTHSKNETTVTFVGAADFHLDSTDTAAIGAGENLYANANLAVTTDIDGEARPSSGAFCIGADEYVTAGGGTVLPIFDNYYNHMRG